MKKLPGIVRDEKLCFLFVSDNTFLHGAGKFNDLSELFLLKIPRAVRSDDTVRYPSDTQIPSVVTLYVSFCKLHFATVFLETAEYNDLTITSLESAQSADRYSCKDDSAETGPPRVPFRVVVLVLSMGC